MEVELNDTTKKMSVIVTSLLQLQALGFRVLRKRYSYADAFL